MEKNDMNWRRVALAGVACVVISGCSGKAERIDTHLRQGNEFARVADWDKASVEVRNVLQMDPKKAEAYYLAAQVEEGRREMQKAYNNYLKAIELKPDYHDAKAGLARILMLAGETTRSEQLVAEVLTAQPTHLGARTLSAALMARRGDAAGAVTTANAIIASEKTIPVEPSLLLAGLYAGQRENEKALQVVEAALQAEPKDISLHSIAAQLYAEKKTDPAAARKAVEHYRAATEAAPRNAELWNVWAVFHSRRDELDQAEAVLRASTKANPDDTKRTLTLLEFLSVRRSVAAAEKEFQVAIAARPKEPSLRFGLVNLYKTSQRPQDAQRVLQEIVALDKDAPSGLIARNQLAAYRLADNQAGAATALLNEVLKVSPRDNTALVLRGRILVSQNNAKDAIIDLRAAIKDQPASPEIVALLAQAHRMAGEPQLAREVITDAVKFKSNDSELKLLLAADMADAGETAQAASLLDEIVQNNPQMIRAYELKAQIAVQQKKWPDAEKTLLALQQQRPKDATGYLRLGQVYAQQKKFDAALKQYDEAARVAPGAPEPVLSSVGLLIGQRKFDLAQARVDALLTAEPKNVLGYQLLGEVAAARGDGAAAQQAYEKVVEVAPTASAGYQKLALVMAQRKDLAGAMAVLQKGQQANPEDLSLPAMHAEWLVRSGKSEEAIAAYEALVKRAPDNDAYANNLAYLLTETKGDPASLKRALELTGRFSSSQNPGYLDSLGWVHYKLGQYEQSVPVLERALARAPTAPLMQLHLGLALVKKGDATRGKELLRKAVQSKADTPDMNEARKILAQG